MPTLEATAVLTPLARLARSGVPIGRQYRELKDEPGLGHFKRRKYPGWADRTVLTAAASSFLQLERHRQADASQPNVFFVPEWMREIVELHSRMGNRRLFNLAPSLRRSPRIRT